MRACMHVLHVYMYVCMHSRLCVFMGGCTYVYTYIHIVVLNVLCLSVPVTFHSLFFSYRRAHARWPRWAAWLPRCSLLAAFGFVHFRTALYNSRWSCQPLFRRRYSTAHQCLVCAHHLGQYWCQRQTGACRPEQPVQASSLARPSLLWRSLLVAAATLQSVRSLPPCRRHCRVRGFLLGHLSRPHRRS